MIEKTLETGAYYFDEYVWGWSNQDERLVLSLVAEATEANEWVGFSVLEGYLERKAALAATKNLVARDILTETTEGGELVFRSRSHYRACGCGCKSLLLELCWNAAVDDLPRN